LTPLGNGWCDIWVVRQGTVSQDRSSPCAEASLGMSGGERVLERHQLPTHRWRGFGASHRGGAGSLQSASGLAQPALSRVLGFHRGQLGFDPRNAFEDVHLFLMRERVTILIKAINQPHDNQRRDAENGDVHQR
jgi:hypothetical protein